MKRKIYLLVIIILIISNFAAPIIANFKHKLRVISLAPNLTETIFKLGRGDMLVGRTSSLKYPPEALKIAVVGGFGSPSIEEIVMLKPSFVITSMLNLDLKQTLNDMNIKLIFLPTNNIDDYFKTVNKLGKLLDAETQAKTEINRVQSGLKKLKVAVDKIPIKKRPKVLLEIWDKPILTVGNKSFLNDYISYAGGRNIAAGIDKGYVNISEEWIILSAPQIILCPSTNRNYAKEIAAQPEWSNIPAVKNNRIYTDLNKNLIYILGPRILEAIKVIKGCIYPNQIHVDKSKLNSLHEKV